jgi:Tfp pilus assembly protein PilZ
MKENRRYTRVRIQSMDVKCKMHFDTDIRLLNVSLSGACISLNKPLDMGGEYTVHIDGPDRTFSLKGTVIWARISGSQKNEKGDILPRYEVGLSFEDILTRKGDDLVHFIEENIVPKQSKVRIKGLRVKVMKPAINAHVKDYKTYNIVRISESGMFIETDQEFDVEEKYRMEIQIPDVKRALQFVGRVASSVTLPENVPFRYGAGIEFIEMSKDGKEKLKKFITSIRKF